MLRQYIDAPKDLAIQPEAKKNQQNINLNGSRTKYGLLFLFFIRLNNSLKIRLIFWPIQAAKENMCLRKPMFKFRINLDRHGQIPITKIRHIPDPPPFSLFTDLKMLVGIFAYFHT
jgi:hypothetical protein